MQNSDARLKTKTISHRSALKTSQASQNYLSRFTSQQSSRKTNLLPPNHDNNPWDFLQARRQSQLNSMFNLRKHKLDQITKDNYAIYERINTQQTHYPKINPFKQNNYKAAHSRFYTIQQSGAQNEENRKILGPISNFKPLLKPISAVPQIHQCQNFLKQKKASKSVSLAKLNSKKLKLGKKQGEGLPVLFQFY